MTAPTSRPLAEALPVRPRKASAGRRRRHHTQLRHRIQRIAPGVAAILITPLWTDGTGAGMRHFIARALTADGIVLTFQAGGSRQITALLQGAYPAANWDHPQTWCAATNTLTDRTTRRPVPAWITDPDAIESIASGHIDIDDDFMGDQ
ncbi:hypothetical protein ACFC09_36320 [Streptomyces sp. NPDC056161]|uniref:hypothetical protein n=1 Tax=Streptomyces sp. NPDC056161 TaxID=3345732 RepID=UPI0035D73F27